jgi:hypothetical protein
MIRGAFGKVAKSGFNSDRMQGDILSFLKEIEQDEGMGNKRLSLIGMVRI